MTANPTPGDRKEPLEKKKASRTASREYLATAGREPSGIKKRVEATRKARTIKALLKVVGRYDKPLQKPQNTPQAELLIESYFRRRCRTDFLYELSDYDVQMLRIAAIRLREEGIERYLWPKYLDFAWKNVGPTTGGELEIPTTRFVAGDFMLQKFRIYLESRRKLNAERAVKMLRDAGYQDTPPAVVLSVAKRAHALGRIPAGLPPRIEEAVQWLLDRYSEIGYALMED